MLGQFALLALVAGASAATLQTRAPASSLSEPGPVGFLFPFNRGWSEATDHVAPCGGYALRGRADYPISGGHVSFKVQQEAEDLQISWSSSSNPLSNGDFKNILDKVSTLTPGTRCFTAPDMAGQGVKAGDKITFRIAYTTYLTSTTKATNYQCADVTILSVADYQATLDDSPDYACTDTYTGSQSTDLSTVPRSGSSSGRNVGPIAAGFIGAAVTIFVIISALVAAHFLGYARIGKERLPRGKAWDDYKGTHTGHKLDDAASFKSTTPVAKQGA